MVKKNRDTSAEKKDFNGSRRGTRRKKRLKRIGATRGVRGRRILASIHLKEI